MNFIWHFRGQNDFVEHYPLQNPNSVLLKMASFRSQDDNTRGCYSESYLSGCKVILRALMILMLMAIQCFFVSGWWRRSRKPVDLLRGQMYEERRILPELWNFFLHHCKYHLMASDEDKADVNQNPLNDILSPNLDFRASCAKAARGLWRHSASFQSGSVLPRISTTGRNFTHSCLWPLDTLESR